VKTKSAIRNPRFDKLTARPEPAEGQSAIRNCRALTVLEMLVSTALLAFIVVGLTAMFVQTQRAFKAGMKQATMTDAGQTIISMVASDLAELSDAQNTNIVNLYWGWAGTNTSVNYQDFPANVYRTNQLQEIYVLIHTNNLWVGVGYAVSNYGCGVGTLYQYMAPAYDPLTTNNGNFLFTNFLYPAFDNDFGTNYFHPVASGVVHLKIRAFDQYGNESAQEQVNRYAVGNTNFSYPVPQPYTNDFLDKIVPPAGLPNSIQLEVGVLEPDAFEQLLALPAGPAQTSFLGKAGAKIQIYRQNIPIAGAAR
jgi:hypothetical protein